MSSFGVGLRLVSVDVGTSRGGFGSAYGCFSSAYGCFRVSVAWFRVGVGLGFVRLVQGCLGLV